MSRATRERQEMDEETARSLVALSFFFPCKFKVCLKPFLIPLALSDFSWAPMRVIAYNILLTHSLYPIETLFILY